MIRAKGNVTIYKGWIFIPTAIPLSKISELLVGNT